MDLKCMVQCFVLGTVANYSYITPILWSLFSLLLGKEEGRGFVEWEYAKQCKMLNILLWLWVAVADVSHAEGLNNQFNNIRVRVPWCVHPLMECHC